MKAAVLLILLATFFVNCSTFYSVRYSLEKEGTEHSNIVVCDSPAFRISAYVFSEDSLVKTSRKQQDRVMAAKGYKPENIKKLGLYAYFLPKDTSLFGLKQASFKLIEVNGNQYKAFDMAVESISSKRPTVYISDATRASSSEPMVIGHFIMDSLRMDSQYILQFNGTVSRNQESIKVSGSDTFRLTMNIYNVNPIR
jgi:hypothetical protein